MTSTADRLRLYEHAKGSWGDEPARTLMELLPPDPSTLATTSDLAVLGGDLRSEMAALRGELRSEMAELRGELRSEMGELRGELRSEMGDLRGELRSEMGELRGELRSELHQALAEQTRTLGMWMIGMVVTSITFSVGSVIAVATVA